MSVTISTSPITVQMTSTLQNVSIAVNNPSVTISFANGEQLPTDPTFNSLTVSTNAEIGNDLDVLSDMYVGDTLTVKNQINTDNLMVNEDTYLTNVNVSNTITTDTIIIGDISNNVTIDKNGITLNGTSTVFDDIQFPFTTAKLIGTSDPSLTKICDNGSGSTGIYSYSFSNTHKNEVFLSQEMPHWYKQGSDITMHLHLYPSSNLGGIVLIDVEYTFNNIGSVLGNSTLVQVPLTIPANSTKKHLYYELLTISGTGLTVSHGIGIRIARRGDLSGDTHESAIWITRAALHVEKDSLGSKTATSK